MTAIRYPDKVWAAIKKLWEVSPKSTSLQTVLDQVADTLGCEVPSIPTTHTRIKREKWKKLTQKELKTYTKTDAKIDDNFSIQDSNKNLNKSISNEVFISSAESKNNENKIDLIISNQASSKLQKIETLRRQAWNIFNITESAIEGLAEYIAKLDYINVAEANENEIRALNVELALFEKMVNIANVASMVNERSTKMLIGLNGFDPDDFKDKKEIQAERTAQLLKLDNLLEEKRLLMAEQQKQAFERNLAAIEDKMRSG